MELLTDRDSSSTLQIRSAPVVQWIEQARPKGWMYVRFVLGAQVFHVKHSKYKMYTLVYTSVEQKTPFAFRKVFFVSCETFVRMQNIEL